MTSDCKAACQTLMCESSDSSSLLRRLTGLTCVGLSYLSLLWRRLRHKSVDLRVTVKVEVTGYYIDELIPLNFANIWFLHFFLFSYKKDIQTYKTYI